MGLTKNYILYCLYISAAFCGCRCKDELPIPERPPSTYRNWHEYWPDNKNTKWVYSVSKLIGSALVDVYDDTFEYVKDSIQVAVIFREYRFKHFPGRQAWIIGNYPFDSAVLRISISGMGFPLFDLNNIQDSGKSKQFSVNGAPFDDRYTVRYGTPVLKNYPTGLGPQNIVYSTIEFQEPYSSSKGYIQTATQLRYAKKMGIVEMIYDYNRHNVPSQTDSSLYLKYTVKKIIP